MGESGGAGASANTYRAAGDAGTAATPPWAAARRDNADGDKADLPRPLGSDHVALPRLWPHRHAVRRPHDAPVLEPHWAASGLLLAYRLHPVDPSTAPGGRRRARRRVTRPHPPPLAGRLPTAPARRPSRRLRLGPPRRRRRLLQRRSSADGAVKHHWQRRPRDRCVLLGLEESCQC